MSEQRIQQYFTGSAALLVQWAGSLSAPIAAAAQTALECVTNGGKVLTCGSAAAAALAQYAAALLMGGLARERPALPALALGAEAATFAALAQRSEGVGALAAQVHALGQPGDALMIFAHPASSDHASLALAVQAAHEREMPVIAMTGEGEAADALGSLLLAADTHIAIAHAHAASVLHAQQLALHCICESLDALLLGDE
ncbi:MAG: SIS domain-containing protein [Ottowia sp.]